jgi:hypothetical protein
MALILYRVMRMRLPPPRDQSPRPRCWNSSSAFINRPVQTTDGKTLTGLTEMTPAQKSLFAALELALPIEIFRQLNEYYFD